METATLKVGQTIWADINQGTRPATVVARDAATGAYLYEYEMPAGTTALRLSPSAGEPNVCDKAVAYRDLSLAWLLRIELDFGLDNLIAEPQQNGRRAAGQQLTAA